MGRTKFAPAPREMTITPNENTEAPPTPPKSFPKYRQITDEIVLTEICPRIEKGLTSAKACRIAYVNYDTFESFICQRGEEKKVRRPEWREAVARARDVFEEYWLDVLRDPNVKNPQVHAAQFLLGAADPERYREQKDQPMAGNVINFILGSDGTILDSQVIEPRGRRGRPLQLKAVDVDKGAE